MAARFYLVAAASAVACGRFGYERQPLDQRDAAGDRQRDAGCVQDAYYADLDRDGHGTGPATPACAMPASHVARDGDCDDSLAFVNPGAAEACNGLDDDCDGQTDEQGCPSGAQGHYADGVEYVLLGSLMTPDPGAAACAAAGMYLVEIDSPEEQAFVWGIAGGASAWTAGTDQAQEGVWRWPRSGTVFWQGNQSGMAVAGVYHNWTPGVEPNNSGAAEHWALMWDQTAGEWADMPDYISARIICERPVP